MNKLIQVIDTIRQKLPSLRRHALKETPTRTIVIDPLLEALGWDVRDPDEVQLEYPTVDGKSVDYALKLNRKPVLLVEAKALDDPLDDVKSITQVVGYASNNGIVWCILTNGIKWRVYRSVEKCPAPDKLMYEVNLEPNQSEGMNAEQIARGMWRFSLDEMAKGTLDVLGEKIFTDGKVRKALNSLMVDPPRPFLTLLQKGIGDDNLSPRRIRESLVRIASGNVLQDTPLPLSESIQEKPSEENSSFRSKGAKKAWETIRARKNESPYNEEHHLSGKPQEAIQLFHEIDRLCLSFQPSGISRRYLAKSINYEHAGKCFCSVHVLRGGLKMWLKLQLSSIENPPSFARDVSTLGHWGTGDVELHISNLMDFEEAISLIRRSFESTK